MIGRYFIAVLWLLTSSLLHAAEPSGKAEDVLGLSSEFSSLSPTVRVIVELSGPSLKGMSDFKRTENIKSSQSGVLNGLPLGSYSNVNSMGSFPMMALEIDANALSALEQDPRVKRIYADKFRKPLEVSSPEFLQPLLYDSTVATHANLSWSAGYQGNGQVVAVLDTGVRTTHEMFTGKVVSEACYSTDSGAAVDPLCPNGSTTQIGSGAAWPKISVNGAGHGTHVAGIAVGDRKTGNAAGDGVARGAKLIAIDVFSQVNDSTFCSPEPVPCVGAADSDIIRGLDRVYALRNNFNIASVNLSLGGGKYTSYCDASSAFTTPINQLFSADILTVVASGNAGYTNAISDPACVSKAIAVGSTLYNGSSISSFSNSANILDMLAPGGLIESADATSNTGYVIYSGTSMASPHVAGAVAVLKGAKNTANASAIESALKTSGRPFRDPRNNLVKPFLQVYEGVLALQSEQGAEINIVPILQLLLL